jgi:hypothetical protein
MTYISTLGDLEHCMIRDHLIAAIKESFPSLPFLFSQSSNPVAKLQPPFAGIGTLDIYDDGE